MSNNIHLVTGATGYIGSKIVKQLLTPSKRWWQPDILKPDTLSKNFEYLDVTDRDGVDRLLKQVTHVHHNAALVPLAKAGKKYQEVNVDGTKILSTWVET